MEHKTAKINQIRNAFGIPNEGFPDKQEALSWYKEHFKIAKNKEFTGSFGFRYDFSGSQLEFDYETRPGGFFIATPCPLDVDVPFDQKVSALANEMKLPEWLAPALRMVVLMGELFDDELPHIPFCLMAPLGKFRLLVHPEGNTSLREWREIGEMLGILPTKSDMWQVPGIMEIYHRERVSKKRDLYWETYLAYQEAISERRRTKHRIAKRGLLKDTAKILESRYDWEVEPDSYTVRRYLDRAEKIWQISTHGKLL